MTGLKCNGILAYADVYILCTNAATAGPADACQTYFRSLASEASVSAEMLTCAG